MLSPQNQDLIDKTSRNTLQPSENRFFQVPRTKDSQTTGRIVGMLKAACMEFNQSPINYNQRQFPIKALNQVNFDLLKTMQADLAKIDVQDGESMSTMSQEYTKVLERNELYIEPLL